MLPQLGKGRVKLSNLGDFIVMSLYVNTNDILSILKLLIKLDKNQKPKTKTKM